MESIRAAIVQHFAIKTAIREHIDELDYEEAQDILFEEAVAAGETKDWFDVETHEYLYSEE